MAAERLKQTIQYLSYKLQSVNCLPPPAPGSTKQAAESTKLTGRTV